MFQKIKQSTRNFRYFLGFFVGMLCIGLAYGAVTIPNTLENTTFVTKQIKFTEDGLGNGILFADINAASGYFFLNKTGITWTGLNLDSWLLTIDANGNLAYVPNQTYNTLGTLTSGKRCIYSGTQIQCTENAPSGTSQWTTGPNGLLTPIQTNEVRFQVGSGAQASGSGSIAMGVGSQAHNNNSTAIGIFTNAYGYGSTAIGNRTTANGYSSTAMGNSTTASGNNSFSIGYGTKASGDGSIAMGIGSQAHNNNSTAIGNFTNAYGYGSTAIGMNTATSGYASIAMGFHTITNEDFSFAVGSYNIGVPGAIFEVGIGTGGLGTTRANAMTILTDGNVGIGITGPQYKLDVNGTGRFSNGLIANNLNINNNISTYHLKVNGGNSQFIIGDGDSFFTIENEPATSTVFKYDINTNIISLFENNEGNVGIGTDSPTNKLDVNGTGRFSNGLLITNGGARITGNTIINGNLGLGISNPTYKLDVVGTGRFSNGLIVSNGGIGIGMESISELLEVNGNIRSKGLCLGESSCITEWPVGGGSSQWTTTGTNKLYYTGNVAIGAAIQATYALDVIGTGRFSSGLCLGTTCISSWNPTNWNTAYTRVQTNSGNILTTGTQDIQGIKNFTDGISSPILFSRQNNILYLQTFGSEKKGEEIDYDFYLTQTGTDSNFNGANLFISAANGSSSGMIYGNGGNIYINGGKSAGIIQTYGNVILGFSKDQGDVTFGNVGIGMDNPLYKLDVDGDINANRLCIGGTCQSSWPVGGGSSQWTTTGTNKLYYTGNVAIGAAIQATYALDVIGTGRFSSGLIISNGGLVVTGESRFNSHVTFNNTTIFNKDISTNAIVNGYGVIGYYDGFGFGIIGDSDDFIATKVGDNYYYGSNGDIVIANNKVGIGITNPEEKIHVNGNIKANGVNVSDIRGFYSETGDGGAISIEGGHGNSGGNIMINGGEAIGDGGQGNVILANQRGNVGIGIENPTYHLDVKGDSRFNGTVILANIRGNVGIGTTGPDYKLDVNGTGRFSNGLIVSNGGAIITGNTIINGNLGLGISNPTYKFHVNGSGYIQNNLTVNQNLIVSGILQLPVISSAPTCSEGAVVYSQNDRTLCFCNGTSWVSVLDGNEAYFL